MRFFVLLSFLGLSLVSLASNPTLNGGYRIEVEFDNFDGDTLLLGYYFGKAQYLKDTAAISKGKFVFEGADDLMPGVYLLVIPPDNKFVHILVTEEESHYSVSVDLNNIVNSAKFKDSPENELYYSYLQELDQRRPLADSLRKQINADSLSKEKYQKQIEKIDDDVLKLQDEILSKHPKSFTAMLIKANRDVKYPDYAELPEDERKIKQFEYYRTHYFDNFDLNDARALRSGLIQTKIDYFLQKLTHQYPDSQSVAMDYLLGKMHKNEDGFRYYLVHFLNEAAKSKRMGMDAVYVHLIDHYYATGMATWTDSAQLKKLVSQAETVRPILIGKVAPNLTFKREDGQPVSIHDIRSPYTVLFFWDPECGHCKKSIPSIVEFYNEYKSKGVEVLSICTKTGQDISSCWSTVKERGMDIWVNAADQFIQSRYKMIYDVKTTPQIFVLDKDKKIIAKKIAGEDLKLVLDEIIKNDLKG